MAIDVPHIQYIPTKRANGKNRVMPQDDESIRLNKESIRKKRLREQQKNKASNGKE